MNNDLEQKLWNAGKKERAYTKELWYQIIDELLDDFREFIDQDFERDSEVQLEIEHPQNPSFYRWLWTEKKGASPLSVTWSAAISGQMTIIEGKEETFYVDTILFLFDTTGRNRLRLKTGESYLLFAFEKQSDAPGRWRSLGWFEDEWGQWEDLGYSLTD